MILYSCKTKPFTIKNNKKKGGAKMSSTGEKPGKGTYICKKCGTKVILDNDNDALPHCPKCNHTEFDKA